MSGYKARTPTRPDHIARRPTLYHTCHRCGRMAPDELMELREIDGILFYFHRGECWL